MDYLYQFLPDSYKYLTTEKKVVYKGINLKTDYIINIMHELIIKYFFTNDMTYNLWSFFLKKKYGKYYNYYMNYLIDNKFMFLVSNYYSGKKAKTYKLNITDLNIIKYKITDKILLNKYKKEYLLKTFISTNDSPINLKLREKLVDFLYHVNIDYKSSKKYIKIFKDTDKLKYFKNYNSIESLKIGHIFFKFDSYGRMHTNFTILKKYIRQNYIKIDDEEIVELDIKNSQPLFLAVLLKKEIPVEHYTNDIKKYIDVVKNGLIYDDLMQHYPDKIKNRDHAKVTIYKVLFGDNKSNKKENEMFRLLYPSVYDFIVEYKNNNNSYKSLSHKLQELESKTIFNDIVPTIIDKIPDIKLITIHDSIIFPKKYETDVSFIFNYFSNKLI